MMRLHPSSHSSTRKTFAGFQFFLDQETTQPFLSFDRAALSFFRTADPVCIFDLLLQHTLGFVKLFSHSSLLHEAGTWQRSPFFFFFFLCSVSSVLLAFLFCTPFPSVFLELVTFFLSLQHRRTPSDPTSPKTGLKRTRNRP